MYITVCFQGATTTPQVNPLTHGTRFSTSFHNLLSLHMYSSSDRGPAGLDDIATFFIGCKTRKYEIRLKAIGDYRNRLHGSVQSGLGPIPFPF